MAARKRDIHVVPRANGWATIREGADRASSLHDNKKEAMDRARDLARSDRVERVEHGRDGRIMGSDSYGNDPCPPKDKG